MPDAVIPFAILIGTGIAAVLLTKLLSYGRSKYNAAVLEKAQAIVDSCETCNEALDGRYTKVNFPVYANLLVIGYEVKVDLYVHYSDRRKLLNQLFKLNLLCSLTSFWMPFLVILAVINYHNNVFSYP
ncbi:MAG TPA: hypothetical protein VM553_16335 [Dongiaceae bacterium]|nr:hypothetical protein [Dongiaceae bacterium]